MLFLKKKKKKPKIIILPSLSNFFYFSYENALLNHMLKVEPRIAKKAEKID